MIRLRRSWLYVPGSSEKMLSKATKADADVVILDLEDAVAPTEKESARERVLRFLSNEDFGGKERVVRINSLSTPFGREDLGTVVRGGPDVILVPKVNSVQEVMEAEEALAREEQNSGLPAGKILLAAMIETPSGVLNAHPIASAHSRVTALVFGAADFTAETRGRITENREELLFPLSQILLAARTAGIDAVDSPYFKIRDLEGLERHVRQALNLGYDGKCVIHPEQIAVVHKVFTPTEEEVTYAKRVIEAYREAEEKGVGAIDLDGQMIERLHMERAERTLLFAEKAMKR